MLKLAYFDNNFESPCLFHESLKKDFYIVSEKSSLNYPNVINNGPYDAIVLAMELNELDGLQLYEKIKSHINYNGCPIIFMAEDDADTVTLFGLQFGADDVVSRHWSPEIKAERIRQRVYRYVRDCIHQLSNLRIDKKRFKVTVNNEHIELSVTEFKLACCLISRYPNTTEFSEIFDVVWGEEMDEKNLHTHLSNLRKKLKGWNLSFKILNGKKIGIIAD